MVQGSSCSQSLQVSFSCLWAQPRVARGPAAGTNSANKVARLAYPKKKYTMHTIVLTLFPTILLSTLVGLRWSLLCPPSEPVLSSVANMEVQVNPNEDTEW